MKHAFFTILYNELPFLKQKMSFLYENFDQIIFYDLYSNNPPHYSTDGSHEYIKEYPDPKNKIILIEKTNLNDIKPIGVSNILKQKMFSYGSELVSNDIDVFWCFDMDEFFNRSLITKVENVFTNNIEIESINVKHYNIFKNLNYILTDGDKETFDFSYALRIVRHKKGNKYGHCSLGSQYPNYYQINDEKIYHFAYFGDERVKFKINEYKSNYFDKWNNFNYEKDKNNPHMHPDRQRISYVKKINIDYPEYIDLEEMKKDFKIK